MLYQLIPFAGLDADGIPQYLIDGKLTTTGVNFQEREKRDLLFTDNVQSATNEYCQTTSNKQDKHKNS